MNESPIVQYRKKSFSKTATEEQQNSRPESSSIIRRAEDKATTSFPLTPRNFSVQLPSTSYQPLRGIIPHRKAVKITCQSPRVSSPLALSGVTMASAYGNMTRYTYSLNEDRETRAGCENSIESDESELFCSLRLETHSASKSYAKYLDFGRLLDEGIGTPTSAYGKETEAFRAAESGTQKEDQSPRALSSRDANPAVATPRGTERRGFAGGRALRHVVPRIAAVESAGAPEGLGGALYPWIPPARIRCLQAAPPRRRVTLQWRCHLRAGGCRISWWSSI